MYIHLKVFEERSLRAIRKAQPHIRLQRTCSLGRWIESSARERRLSPISGFSCKLIGKGEIGVEKIRDKASKPFKMTRVARRKQSERKNYKWSYMIDEKEVRKQKHEHIEIRGRKEESMVLLKRMEGCVVSQGVGKGPDSTICEIVVAYAWRKMGHPCV